MMLFLTSTQDCLNSSCVVLVPNNTRPAKFTKKKKNKLLLITSSYCSQNSIKSAANNKENGCVHQQVPFIIFVAATLLFDDGFHVPWHQQGMVLLKAQALHHCPSGKRAFHRLGEQDSYTSMASSSLPSPCSASLSPAKLASSSSSFCSSGSGPSSASSSSMCANSSASSNCTLCATWRAWLR